MMHGQKNIKSLQSLHLLQDKEKWTVIFSETQLSALNWYFKLEIIHPVSFN